MKRCLVLIGLTFLILVGCGKTSSETKPSTTKTASTVKKFEDKKTALKGEVNGTQHRYIITQKGNKIQQMMMEVTADLPESMVAIAGEKSPEELTKLLNDLLAQNEEFKNLQAIEGFQIEYRVTEDKKLFTKITVDVEKVDPQAVEQISYFKDAGIKNVKEVKADTLIKALKLHGFEEEK